jgi:hypothetical protein
VIGTERILELPLNGRDVVDKIMAGLKTLQRRV